MKIYLFCLLVSISSCSLFTQPSNQFLPLAIHNKWFYDCSFSDGYYYWHANYRVTITVVDSLYFDNTKFYRYDMGVVIKDGNISYFRCDNFLFSSSTAIIRYDPLTKNVSFYNAQGCPYSPNEKMEDSLNASLNDTIYLCHSSPEKVCSQSSVDSKTFYWHYGAYTEWTRQYNRGLGQSMSSYSTGPPQYVSSHSTLVGSIINGVASGDTNSLVGIGLNTTENPFGFTLYQNYPNPFNPSTRLKFDIPVGNGRDRSVKLVIYDVLGCELTTLVNEQLNPGTYEVEWDASTYPSGTYFYRLEAGDYIETKKMLMIK